MRIFGIKWNKVEKKHVPVMFKIQKETSTKICIHHFKSDLANNMDHTRILGTETLVSDPKTSPEIAQRASRMTIARHSMTYSVRVPLVILP